MSGRKSSASERRHLIGTRPRARSLWAAAFTGSPVSILGGPPSISGVYLELEGYPGQFFDAAGFRPAIKPSTETGMEMIRKILDEANQPVEEPA